MSMFERSQNSWEKTDFLNILYLGLDLNQLTIATQFYERIKDKPLEVLERYYKVIRPRGFCDTISYEFDRKRQAKRTALFKVRSEKGLEREEREIEDTLRYMSENGMDGCVSGGFGPPVEF